MQSVGGQYADRFSCSATMNLAKQTQSHASTLQTKSSFVGLKLVTYNPIEPADCLLRPTL